MDGIGDYIYLIVIIVAAISSLLKKRKQQESIPQKSFQVEDEDQDDEMITEYIPRKDSKVIIPENKVENKILSYENSTNFSELRVTKQLTKYERIKSKTDINNSETEIPFAKINIELKTSEDAKTAFIYSEIFNRKF